jgi:hypothetical protein
MLVDNYRFLYDFVFQSGLVKSLVILVDDQLRMAKVTLQFLKCLISTLDVH